MGALHPGRSLFHSTSTPPDSKIIIHNSKSSPSPEDGRTTGRGAAQRNPCNIFSIRHRTPEGWQEHINRHPAAPTGLCVLLSHYLQGFRPAASTPACIPTSPPGTCACPPTILNFPKSGGRKDYRQGWSVAQPLHRFRHPTRNPGGVAGRRTQNPAAPRRAPYRYPVGFP